MKDKKLNWIQFTGGNKGYAIELIFDGDHHYEILIEKGMTPKEIGDRLIMAGVELQDSDNWN